MEKELDRRYEELVELYHRMLDISVEIFYSFVPKQERRREYWVEKGEFYIERGEIWEYLGREGCYAHIFKPRRLERIEGNLDLPLKIVKKGMELGKKFDRTIESLRKKITQRNRQIRDLRKSLTGKK